MDFSGVFPALTTPYDPDGSVSLGDLKHNILHYNKTDLAGFVALGSTGESVLLTPAEMEGVLITVKENAAKEKKLIAGCGSESTAETIARVKRAAEIGYHAALVKTPYYYKPFYKTEALIAHYKRVADASTIPVLLYSVPQFTGVALEASEVAVLSEHPNIAGIKDSSGNVQRLAEMIASTPPSFQILVGSAATVFPSLTIGARGAILALACALPEKCTALYQLHRHGQQELAREMQNVLVRASKTIVSELGIAGVKFVMDQRGYRGGQPRLPLLPLEDWHRKRITAVLATVEPASVGACSA
ncbi:MAG TPA: dihydrodipicolinate synthase family protein [Candidatus Acidoferrum sp.]|nr:dihydrodipicolinate synthase family protein [Candidatus Acidoferrum sp.]